MAIQNRNDPESDPAFQRLAEDVARALIGDTVRRKTKKALQVEELKRSDLGAQLTGRSDIEYGHHETLPRGEHVMRRKP
jgi:hypothetical protein